MVSALLGLVWKGAKEIARQRREGPEVGDFAYANA